MTFIHKTIPYLGDVNAALLIICVGKIVSGYVCKSVVWLKEETMMTKTISQTQKLSTKMSNIF